jgi:hypothetical protein
MKCLWCYGTELINEVCPKCKWTLSDMRGYCRFANIKIIDPTNQQQKPTVKNDAKTSTKTNANF